MNFHQKLYTAESVAGIQKQLMRQIKQNRLSDDIYIIIRSVTGNNLFDIVSGDELKKPHLREAAYTVVGIAGDRDEALELTRTIIEDMYRETGSIDADTYFGL